MDIQGLLKNKKSMGILAALFIVGVMLIMGTDGGSVKYSASTDNESTAGELDRRLENILSRVEGAGRVRVLINYRQSGEKILAYDMESNTQEKDSNKENTSKSEVVYDGNKMPVVLKEYMPKVEGVIIVAQGGNIESVKKQLIAGTVALLGVEEHKIEVLKMK